jgi:hypothetical protein
VPPATRFLTLKNPDPPPSRHFLPPKMACGSRRTLFNRPNSRAAADPSFLSVQNAALRAAHPFQPSKMACRRRFPFFNRQKSCVAAVSPFSGGGSGEAPAFKNFPALSRRGCCSKPKPKTESEQSYDEQ